MEAADVEENLVHCIYASAATEEFSQEELEELLAIARENNQQLGVTGMLLYEKGSFFQILEGKAEAVLPLYEKISKDTRHAKITKLIYEPIEARDFADWSMGLASIPLRELSQIEGLNDFFKSGKCFADLDDGRAKTLLQSFKEGRWRTTITGN